jgi:hypothetical protein
MDFPFPQIPQKVIPRLIRMGLHYGKFFTMQYPFCGVKEDYKEGNTQLGGKMCLTGKKCFQLEKIFFLLCCFPNNLEYFFVCFLFFINQLPISPLFYLFS